MRPITHPDVTEDIVEQLSDHFVSRRSLAAGFASLNVFAGNQTQAMVISTQHLLPAAIPHPMIFEQIQGLPPSGPQTPGLGQQPAFVVAPQPAGESAPPQTSVNTVESLTAAATPIATATKTEGEASESVTPAAAEPADVPMKEETPAASVPAPSTAPDPGISSSNGASVEVIDVDAMEDKPAVPTIPADQVVPVLPPQPLHIYPGGYTIDVCFEASKLPLDVAIFNSARAAGGDEKIRKYLQAVLVIGGTALVPGMAHALESRYVCRATDPGATLMCAWP